MAVNIFRPIDGDTILPDRIIQGQSWNNISFGVNATIADYQAEGLYLETGDKPAYTIYQYLSAVTETLNHITKEVELAWTVLDKTQAEIDEIDRLAEIELAQETEAFSILTVTAAENWVGSRIDLMTDLTQIKVQLRLIFKKVIPYLLK